MAVPRVSTRRDKVGAAVRPKEEAVDSKKPMILSCVELIAAAEEESRVTKVKCAEADAVDALLGMPLLPAERIRQIFRCSGYEIMYWR